MNLSVINRLADWYFSKRALPYWGLLILDSMIVVFSGYLAKYLEVGGLNFAQHFWLITNGLVVCLAFFMIAFRLFHTYSGVARYTSFVDLQRIIRATALGSVLTCLVGISLITPYLSEWVMMPDYGGILMIFAFSTLAMKFLRIAVKSVFDTFRLNTDTIQISIYGLRDGGIALAKMIRNQEPQRFVLKSFISPDGQMADKILMGVRVNKVTEDLGAKLKEANVKAVLVSPIQVDKFRADEDLINDLIEHEIKIYMIPRPEEWDGKSDFHSHQLQEVDIEDLLPRDKIDVDLEAIGALLQGKRILITGAAGSIGSEMVRQVAQFNPAEVVLIDHAETPMHNLRLMMARQFGEIKSETIVGSINNQKYMEAIFAEHQPEYVFHAAAYKHVPMMEDNPAMAVQNNIYGTRVIADLAVKYGTKKFVMISTDKAVNPTNVMGCSKRICEIYCQSLNQAILDGKVKGVTQFVTTRFGNVLGSNGSVIPLFKEQIKSGGPITVTHPDIIRFFMLIPEACRLVLEAGTMGKGGEIFVFDMGKPVRIVDLAKRMIKLSGVEDIEIKFTGLRDGEKLFEEVLSEKEENVPTKHPKIMVAKVREYDYEVACENERQLLELSETFDHMAIVKKMKEIVPEYKSKVSKYESLDKQA